MAPPEKLTDAAVKKIRRRIRAGEYQTELAREFGVNRKTIRRRLDELKEAEAMAAERVAASRLRRQAAREKQKLRERDQAAASVSATDTRTSREPSRSRRTHREDPYYLEWLDRPKGMTWREASRARGDVRMKNADSTIKKWVEREQVDALLDQGWLLAD
jgi:HTH domain